MRRFVRALALTGATAAAGALTLLTAPTAQAAPSDGPACVTAAGTKSFGRGEIAMCPQSDGTTRVTGWVEDLLPGKGWGGTPDGRCAGWWIEIGAKGGMVGPLVCPHFTPSHEATYKFDYTFKPQAPVTGAKLNAFTA
ncbi:hypothetical protein [Streptomyces albireticuli]|uniref:Secreted protein n=1 Tax=Streptomyces albireticuli TaxID=1940 RepID=A0A2A2DC73_9ACTN|nr:hypothetical protein [Streptomyces albireticuli]MCD9141265.1 hypothetical protein [Streptomyces albireticuli]MCD9160774.1 hypothetical protein [Streptomyces albireticuli]MCD9191169.1 hypothetical protein [Streptomyces albireticuli]PAU49047.1 hypothetical protein CK936_09775 [Streptomyces albireticuli]